MHTSLLYTPSPISVRGGYNNNPELSTNDALDIHLDWEPTDDIWTAVSTCEPEVVLAEMD